jgi:hypothetical protein
MNCGEYVPACVVDGVHVKTPAALNCAPTGRLRERYVGASPSASVDVTVSVVSGARR